MGSRFRLAAWFCVAFSACTGSVGSGPDTAPNLVDAGPPAKDAGALVSDASVDLVDAGHLSADAGVDHRDAGAGVADGGIVATDAGQVASDAGVAANDSGVGASDAGNSCTSQTSTAWVTCAAEYGTCSFSGTRRVLYGLSLTEACVVKTFSDGVVCDNAHFGDPAVGGNKSCWVEAADVSVDSGVVDGGHSGGSGNVEATFSGSTEDFLNPERGFYVTPSDSEMVASTLTAFSNEWHVQQFLYLVSLASYRDTPTLPQAFLDGLNARLAEGRKAGVKFILLFAYNYDSGGADAAIDLAVSHAAQLKPLMHANADIIPYLKAGFVGSYGEWWGSQSGLDTKANKRRIKDAVLDMAAPTTMVQFTQVYPMQEDWYPTVLGASQAFTGTDQARSGFHNDCFMAKPDDSYTYPGPGTVLDFTFNKTAAEQRQYVAGMTEYVPFGGETCDNTGGTLRTSCHDPKLDNANQSGGILNEGPRYHLTWLNAGYSPAFINQWKTEGCFDEVSRSMGYRFQLDRIQHAALISRGQSVDVQVDLRNVGWSRIFTARKLVVTLKHQTDATAPIIEGRAGDMRLLPSQAAGSTRVTVTVDIPPGAPVGDYAVSLSMPDVFSTTASDPRFSVRFANGDDASKGQAWVSASAQFAVGTALTVQ